MRAGAHALSLLSVPFNAEVLAALADGPRPRAEISRVLGHPPETTMRTHLKRLAQLGIVDLRRHQGFPGCMDLALDKAGVDLLPVANALQDWLARAPEGPIPAGAIAARSSTKALIDGWSTGMLRALSARSLSLTQLDGLIPEISYPSLERRLVAMRGVGLLYSLPAGPRGRPVAVTPWLREAVVPLIAAVRWESRHLPDSSSLTQRDIETAFLLSLPLLRLGIDTSGTCRLAIEIGVDGRNGLVGVTAEFDQGRLSSVSSRLKGTQTAAAVGSPSGWISAVLDGAGNDLELSGDVGLAAAVVRRLSIATSETLRKPRAGASVPGTERRPRATAPRDLQGEPL